MDLKKKSLLSETGLLPSVYILHSEKTYTFKPFMNTPNMIKYHNIARKELLGMHNNM
uniref:Uncharacterized protein n=1 Tax=Anguilla anguilla TaxID=7936 RepID=A0A0E9XNE4_ANGAN